MDDIVMINIDNNSKYNDNDGLCTRIQLIDEIVKVEEEYAVLMSKYDSTWQQITEAKNNGIVYNNSDRIIEDITVSIKEKRRQINVVYDTLYEYDEDQEKTFIEKTFNPRKRTFSQLSVN